MKRSTIARTFTIAAVTALALGVAPTAKAHDKTCSKATLKGTYTHIANGIFTARAHGLTPFAAVSTITYDGNGAFTDTVILSLDVNIVPPQTDPALVQTVTGTVTYTVHPDCTGIYTVQTLPLGLTGHGFFVIDDSGNEF